MKRTKTEFMGSFEGDFSGKPGSKRSRNYGYEEALAEGKYELRILIPSKTAGAVIGKGGEFIKSIRQKFDANVTVPDKSTPERVLSIISSQNNIIDCFSEIWTKLSEDRRDDTTDVRMLVHQSHAGALIGRAGSKIKELREQTKSQLKVYQDCCPQSTDRILLITARESMSNAIRVIIDFLKTVPLKGPQKPYDSSNYDPRLDYGGFIDKSFTPSSSGPSFDNYRDHYDGGMAPSYGPPIGSGGPVPLGGFPQDPVSTAQVTIPNELGGTIIGKGGERINRIRAESGAKIDIGDAYGSEERIISITGTRHQIQNAQYLLQQSVRMSEAGRRYLRSQR